MIPYDAAMIGAVLRRLPDTVLARITPQHFQRHPATVITKAGLIAEMISRERDVRNA